MSEQLKVKWKFKESDLSEYDGIFHGFGDKLTPKGQKFTVAVIEDDKGYIHLIPPLPYTVRIIRNDAEAYHPNND